MESPELGDRFRSVLLFVLAVVLPGVAAYSVARGEPLYGLAAALNPRLARQRDWPERILVVLLAATVVAAIHVALGLVFDPRYKDFPLAPLTAAIVSLAIVAFGNRANAAAGPGAAEVAIAATLCGSAIFIVVNESAANWQAVWLSLLLVLLGLTTVRARRVQD
jgi:glucan 1,3-beta-glucosidase